MNTTIFTSTNGVHHPTDEAIDQLYSWMPSPTTAPTACPEAVFSLTLKGKMDGQEALLTARGMTATEFKRNLEAIRGLLDPVAPTAAQPLDGAPGQAHSTAEGFCPVHNVQMKENHKEGRTWYSHYDEAAGRWCKGK